MTKMFVNASKEGYSDIAVLSWSRFPHRTASRFLRNSLQKGDLRKRKIFILTVVALHFCVLAHLHIIACVIFVCFVIYFLPIPFASYIIFCLLTICNWKGSQLLVQNAGWMVRIFAHINGSWFAVEAGLYTKVCYGAWLRYDALLRFPVPHIAVCLEIRNVMMNYWFNSRVRRGTMRAQICGGELHAKYSVQQK